MSKKNQNFQNIIIHYLNNIDMPKSSRVELYKKKIITGCMEILIMIL